MNERSFLGLAAFANAHFSRLLPLDCFEAWLPIPAPTLKDLNLKLQLRLFFIAQKTEDLVLNAQARVVVKTKIYEPVFPDCRLSVRFSLCMASLQEGIFELLIKKLPFSFGCGIEVTGSRKWFRSRGFGFTFLPPFLHRRFYRTNWGEWDWRSDRLAPV